MPLWFLGFGNVGTLLAVVSPTKTHQPTNMSLSPFDTALEGRGLALGRSEVSTCNRVYLEVVNCSEVKVHVRNLDSAAIASQLEQESAALSRYFTLILSLFNI